MKVHVLTGDTSGLYTLVIHIPVPATNNAGGVAWQAALVNSKLGGTSQLTTGTGPGQITAAELAQVAAGQVYETTATIQTQGTAAAGLGAAVDALATKVSAERLVELQKVLNWFGVVRT